MSKFDTFSALHVPGTAALFDVADEDYDAALDAKVVHVGGTGLLKAFDGAPTVQAFAQAGGQRSRSAQAGVVNP